MTEKKTTGLRALLRSLVFAGSATAAAQDLVISEFMASNTSTAVTGQAGGQFYDWIEIHNRSSVSVNLSGWHLTDDENIPFKWTFPGATIPPGGFEIVFASGINASANGVNHTNFALGSDGGYLALVRPDLVIESSHDYPKQFADVSFGFPDAASPAVHLTEATPGAANVETEYLYVRDTSFSHKRGHYSAPFELTISTNTPSATIRYTIDGSEPEASGNGITYSSPINISTTTVLRARAFRSGYAPTNVDTQTYIFPEAVTTQIAPPGYPTNWQDDANANYEVDQEISLSALYQDRFIQSFFDLPTVSVATGVGQLFGPSGIYTNSLSDAFEASVSAEYFLPDSGMDGRNLREGFQIDCGLKVQGGSSRNPSASNKHSFSFRFRKEYGSGKLDYGLFEGTSVDEFDSLQLRAMYNNSWIHSNSSQRERGTMLRDQWMRESLIATGQADGGHGHFVHLFLNGLYWGVYNLHEKHNNEHYAAYQGGDPETIDTQNPSSYAPSFNAMKSLVANGDWPDIAAAIDVDSYIDYYLIQHFGRNDDMSTTGNWRAAGGGSSNAPWRFYVWDSERVLESVSSTGPLAKSQDGAGLIDFLDNHEEFRIRFADRAQKHLFNGGALTTERNLERFTRLSDQIDRAIVAESARWGDDRRSTPYTRDNEWITEVNKIKNTFFPASTPNRTTYFISKLRNESWGGSAKLLEVEAPLFEVNGSPRHGGQVNSGDQLGFANASGTIYYTTDGSDPRVPAIGGTPISLLSDGAPCTVFVPSDDSLGLSWTGRLFDDSGWISGTSGIGYDNLNGSYIGLFNTDIFAMKTKTASCYLRVPFNIPDQATLDSIGALSLNLKFEDGFVAWINGTRVGSDNAPASLAWDSTSLGNINRNETDAVAFTAFDATAGIPGLVVGENILSIQLLNSTRSSSDILCVPELTYLFASATGVSSSANFYTTPFSLSSSTTLTARARNGSDWSPLVQATFVAEAPAAPGDLVISELHYHPSDPTPQEFAAGQGLTPPRNFESSDFEFIEIQSTSDQSINLDGVSFIDGIDYTFGSVMLAPGERLILASDPSAFTVRYATPSGTQILGPYSGSLSNGGENLTYLAADGSVMQSFAYGDEDPWPSEADGSGFSLQRLLPTTLANQPLDWTASAPTPGSGMENDDPDGDAIPTLLEYALNLDPFTPDNHRLPKAVIEDGNLTYRYPRDLGKTEISYQVEISNDLIIWEALDDTVESTSDGIEVRKASVPHAESKRFLRLKVEVER